MLKFISYVLQGIKLIKSYYFKLRLNCADSEMLNLINIGKITPESLNSHEICFLSKQSQLEANAVVRKDFCYFMSKQKNSAKKPKCISFSSSLLDLVVCIIFGRRVVQATSQSINFMVQSRQSNVCQIQLKKKCQIFPIAKIKE